MWFDSSEYTKIKIQSSLHPQNYFNSPKNSQQCEHVSCAERKFYTVHLWETLIRNYGAITFGFQRNVSFCNMLLAMSEVRDINLFLISLCFEMSKLTLSLSPTIFYNGVRAVVVQWIEY